MMNQAAQFGITNISDINALAKLSLREGLNRAQIDDLLGQRMGSGNGVVGASMTDIRALAHEYGVNLAESQITQMARSVVLGDMTVDSVRNTIAEQAKASWPHLAEQIDRGVLPGQYFSPHRQMIANAIGDSVENIDLFSDPRWSQVVSHADGSTVRPMTLDEVSRFVRSTEEFGNSRNGQAEGAAFAQELTRMLGKRRG